MIFSDFLMQLTLTLFVFSNLINKLFYNLLSCWFQDDLAAVGAITAAICDSSYEAWATGEPDSSTDSSSYAPEGDTAVYRSDYWTCVQCKTQNSNPRFQFCDRCFQVSINSISFHASCYCTERIAW